MSNSEAWKAWEGRTVDGKFPLKQFLGGSDHSAVFLTERGQAGQKAAIKLIASEGTGADAQLAQWRSVAQLSHPHLISAFESGRTRLDNTSLLYLVMELADEDLSQILPQRPLAPAEVSDLLPPVLDALTYLHRKGFVHGRIKPSNVLAVGEQLKLSPDQVSASADSHSALRRRDVFDAPETAAGILTPASDVWSVGVTLVAALTQNVSFSADESKGDPGLPQIAEPFRGIARECLHLDPKRRCSIAEIQARLQPAARSVPATPEAPPAVKPSGSRGPIFAVIAVLVLLVGFFLFRSCGKSAPAPTDAKQEQPASQATPVPTPATPAAPEPAQPPKKIPATRGEVLHQVLPDVSQSAERDQDRRGRSADGGRVAVRYRLSPGICSCLRGDQ